MPLGFTAIVRMLCKAYVGAVVEVSREEHEEYTRGRSTEGALSGAEDELRPNVERVGAERASITCRTRWPDSPYVESIMHGRTLSADSPTRPAECHWHMVFAKKDGEVRVVFVGPWTTTGVAHYAEGAEILWIKYKLGAFLPHLPAGRFLDTETVPTRCFESILLAKGFRVGVSRLRERGDVRRQACAQGGTGLRPARERSVARPITRLVTADGATPLLAGHRAVPKPHSPDRARPTGGDPPATRQPDL